MRASRAETVTATGSAGGRAIQDSRMNDRNGQPRRRRFVDTLKAVSWAFFGVRKGIEWTPSADQRMNFRAEKLAFGK